MVFFTPYEHIRLIFIYKNESLNFKEVVCKIISEERRLEGEDNTSPNSVLVSREMPNLKKNSGMSERCLKCEKIEHTKYNFHDKAASEKSHMSNAIMSPFL